VKTTSLEVKENRESDTAGRQASRKPCAPSHTESITKDWDEVSAGVRQRRCGISVEDLYESVRIDVCVLNASMTHLVGNFYRARNAAKPSAQFIGDHNLARRTPTTCGKLQHKSQQHTQYAYLWGS
jgi:hypothetical protein